MCDLGDVMNTALPSSFKLASESKVTIHSDFDGNVACLQEDEVRLLEILADKDSLNINQISRKFWIFKMFLYLLINYLKTILFRLKKICLISISQKIRVVNYMVILRCCRK